VGCVPAAEDPGTALGPEEEPGAGELRPSALANSLTAHVHASGLNGVLAAKEPATTAEAVPTSMPRDQDAYLARGVGQ